MRHIYSFLMYLLSPYLLIRLWWKGRRLPAYRQRIAERFVLDSSKKIVVDIWVHAVSLGEVIAAIPLIDSLLDRGWTVLITTMTPTGAERVHGRFGDRVHHRYVPYDLPWVLRRFFKKVKPRLGLIVETELWPNLIHFSAQQKIPLFLINGRLSDRSCQNYLKIKWLIKPLLNQFTRIFAQSADDARRFEALGAEHERVVALGNMKFDLQIPDNKSAIFADLQTHWGKDRSVVIAASTHEDEELQILSRLKKLQVGVDKMILLIAPRHPERFQSVYQLAVDQGFNVGLRSKLSSLNPDNEVVILDCLGELMGFYQISDYAFVGGSLVPVGGHNMLEPIAMQVPVFSGPQVHNFKTICRDLQEAQAIEIASDADDLVARIIAVHQDQAKRTGLVENATAVLESNKGAVARYVAEVGAVLG